MNYVWSDDDEEIKMVCTINNDNNNNYCNVVSDSKRNDKVEENLFNRDFDMEVKATLLLMLK